MLSIAAWAVLSFVLNGMALDRDTTIETFPVSFSNVSGATTAAAPPTDVRSTNRAAFSVLYRGNVFPNHTMAVFVLPGDAVDLAVIDEGLGERYRLQAHVGTVASVDARRWTWQAPHQSGHFVLSIDRVSDGEGVTVNAFVLVPFDHKSEWLNGYRIGRYATKPYRNNPLYVRPPGFIEVTKNNVDVRVSPNFTLGQFLCKQSGDFPKYVVLREELLLKLEFLLEQVNARGVPASSFHVMSGFRTPHYNKSIGNKTIYSRHLYGDAADIFVDVDQDNYMDDLDRDGRVELSDARSLARVVDEAAERESFKPLLGGLGVYGKKSHRGPFIHVDVRGERARW